MALLVTNCKFRLGFSFMQCTHHVIRDSADTANYLKFVKALREKLDAKYTSVHKLITLAVGTSVFNDASQNPITKLDSDWAKNVDYFYVMVILNFLLY